MEEEPIEEEEIEGAEREREEEYDYFGQSPDFEPSDHESLPSLPREEPEPEPERKPKRKVGWAWKKPSTKVYPDTFSFFVNSYQPMIDYLDLKDAGLPVNKKDIHLPFSEERCLKQFSPTKPFKWYTNTDIDRYIAKGEKIRTQIRQNDAACASNVLRRTHTNWSMTKKYVQLVKNSYVTDPRKISGASIPFKASVLPRYSVPSSTPQKYLLVPIENYYNPFGNMVDVTTAHQIDHDILMASRRKRMRDIDDQIGVSINHMTATSGLMNRPSAGEEVFDIPIGGAADILLSNRSRREEEMDCMMDHVNDLTNADSDRNVSRRMYSNELSRIQNDRLNRKPAKSRVVYVENPVDSDIDSYLRSRRTPVIVELDTPRYRKPKEDTISHVQDRVYQRANEITGTTSEMRRIKDRSKFLNIMGPRTTSDIVPIGYTKTADNIEHMARDFASKGKAVRRFETDQEMDELHDLILNANANMLRKTYSTEPARPAAHEPADPLASNSLRVREAQGRASTRNALLHGY